MRVFILDGDGVGVDFALRCKMAGHEVKIWIAPSKHKNIGRGLVERIADWRKGMRWADLIYMTDDSKYYSQLQPFFDEHYPIWGTNPKAAKLETDRKYGMDVMKACGIDVPAFHSFKKYEEAEAFIQKEGGRWACKPFNDNDKSKAYLCKDAADMMYMFGKWKKEGPPKCDFMLQEFIPGIEFAVGGFFAPGVGWLGEAFCENFENKKFMNDNVGCNTGEMGTSAKWVKDSKLADEVLKPVTSVLTSLDFHGYCDVNVIVDKDGKAWPLEFTVRAGWPMSYLQYSMNKGDPCQWMLDAINGTDTLKVKSSVAVGVLMAMHPFPWDHNVAPEIHEGIPIYGIDELNIQHIHVGTVQAGSAPHMINGKVKDHPCFVTAGNYIAVPVGLGDTVKQASDRAYTLLGQLHMPNSPLYRTDIGKREAKAIPDLQEFGYATEWEYE